MSSPSIPDQGEAAARDNNFQRKAIKIFQKYKLGTGKGLSMFDMVDEIEQLAADEYGHVTVDGWCCACPADIAFMESRIKDLAVPSPQTPEMKEEK